MRAAFAAFEGQYTAPAFAATTPTPEQITGRFPEGPIWLAERDGQVLGTVSVVPGPGELYIRSMAVHPAARGQGIGARLLRAVEDFATPQGYRRLTLTTTSFLRPAIRLYEQAGFRFTGEQGDLFGTGLLWMAKDLSMRRRIVGFHPDSESQWIAELECGHTLHVRHEPPWQVRPWVLTAEGRAAMVGTSLDCSRCGVEGRGEEAPPGLGA